MESLDKYLALTLRQDLEQLNEASAEILKYLVKSENSPSWLYPTKKATRISMNENVDPEKMYTRCLELIIDRIYFIINLFLNYFSTLPELEVQYSKSSHLTLGRSMTLFWEYFKSLIKAKNFLPSEQNMEKPSNLFQNTSSQTINVTNEQCRTCGVATSCVKTILKALESLNQVEIEKARQHIKDNIFDLTQMECINTLTNTAENIVDRFCDDYAKLEKSLANYQFTLVNNMSTLHKVLEDFRILDTVHYKLRHKLESDRDAFENLKIVNRELKQTNLKNSKTITSLKLELEKNEEKLKSLKNINCGLVEDIRMLMDKCSILEAEKGLLKKQLEDLGTRNNELKIKSEYLHRKLENLNCELNQAHANLLDFERRLTNTTDNVERSIHFCNALFKKIEKIQSAKSGVCDKATAVNPEDFYSIGTYSVCPNGVNNKK